MNISSKAIKGIMQKARRRISAFQKAFKQGKLNKKSYEKSKETNILDLQEYLKTSNKKFRRYNRKIGMYEPITPRGKLKQSSEFEQFVLDINQFINETRTAQEEIERQDIIKQHNLSDDILNLMDIQGIDVSEYDSDSDDAKHLHLDNAMNEYNIDLFNSEQMKKISQLSRNLENYNLRDIYDAVYSIANESESGAVFSEI